MLLIARLPGKLEGKINGILLLFFISALCLILATLYVGHQMEGGAAAINEAGAERMRTYRIAYLLDQSAGAGNSARRDELLMSARTELEAFETAMALLEQGDPGRPLFLPREPRLRSEMQSLHQQWDAYLRPLMQGVMDARDSAERQHQLEQLDKAVRDFVPMINRLVLRIEKSNSRNTELMWLFQNALVGFALIGTLFLVYVFKFLVIRPVEKLKQGMDSMAAADFGVRLPVESGDEFGELAQGFNRMADRLRGFYGTLEQRVADKTRDIEEKNRELAVLYEIAAYLTETAELKGVCRGVLEKLCTLLDADAAAVRLINAEKQELEIIASTGLSEQFLRAEESLPLGTCLCGKAAVSGSSVVDKPADLNGLQLNCIHDGLTGMAAIAIKSKNHVIGIFNIFFRSPRVLAHNEVQLLEAVGQHLGISIDNLRLAVREKEMAVSEERNMLAQELHDSIAQSLAFLNIQAQMLHGSLDNGQMAAAREELGRMREGIQESYDNVRELLVHFRIKVEHADLDDAIMSALEKFEGQTGIRTSFRKCGGGVVPSATSMIQVLHIIQEALSNARKHAQATLVEIEMRCGGEPSIKVRDNGRGFDPETIFENGGSHVGIGIMRERAHRIGAHLRVESTPGDGTCVTLALPQ